MHQFAEFHLVVMQTYFKPIAKISLLSDNSGLQQMLFILPLSPA